jgi:triphosphoribosyl-dephospho-CoA synthetase
LWRSRSRKIFLHVYGLEDIAASITKAQMDAGTAMTAIEVGAEGFIFAVDTRGIIVVHPDAATIGSDVSSEDWFQQLKRERGRLTFKAGDETHLAIYDYFKPWDWFVLAADSEQDVYGAANHMQPYIFTIGLSARLSWLWF